MMKDTFLKGLLIGLVVPCLGYIMVSGLFEILVDMGVMDAASTSISSRRVRTTTLMGICMNIISIRLFKHRSQTPVVRGIVTATIACSVAWLFYFYESFLG